MYRPSSLLMCNFVVAAWLTAVAPQALATVVFSDDSENSTVGVIPNTTDPNPGTWDYTSNDPSSKVLTKSGASADGPTAAASGSNYLMIGRGDAGTTANVGAMLDQTVDASTYDLHASFDMWNENTFQYQSTGIGFMSQLEAQPWAAAGSVLKGPIYVGDRTGNGVSGLYYNSMVPDAWVDTGLTLNNGAWNAMMIDWDAGTSTMTIGVNGSTVVVTAAGTATSIERLQFFPAGGNCQAFYDNLVITTNQVPEPSTLALLVTGLLGLLACARRKRVS